MELLNASECFQDHFKGRAFIEKTLLDFYFYYEFICPMIGLIIVLAVEAAKRLGYIEERRYRRL